MPVLLLIVGINFIGVGALIPVLPYTVIETLGLPASVMTLLLASYAFAMFIANPILGGCPIISGGAGCCWSRSWSAPPLISGSRCPLISSRCSRHRIIAGFAAGNTGVIQAMIADRTSAEKRAQYMGLLGAAIGVGFVAGPALGGLLSHVGGGPVHQAPFLLAAAFSLLALLMTSR